jgi:hypothetical protein
MKIVPANIEHDGKGFRGALELEPADIEKIEKALNEEDPDPIGEIVIWARKEGNGKPIINKGQRARILIQTGDSDNSQFSLPVMGLYKALDGIL